MTSFFIRLRLAVILGGWLVSLALPAAANPNPDWQALGTEGSALLSQYLRIDTTVPPGNEMQAAKFLKAWFDKEGIANEIFDLGGGRANFFALLPGKAKRAAIIFSNHMDVVYADPSEWKLPPFSGEIKDGFIWGRGAIDMKNLAVAQMMAMAAMKRLRLLPDRDIIFLALADEENTSMGARRFIAEHKALLRGAGYFINEGAYITPEADGATYCGVAVAEKAPLWLKITARGPGGHASDPLQASAPNRIIRAAHRLLEWQRPLCLTPAVREWFQRMADLQTEPWKSLYAHIDSTLADPSKVKLLLEHREELRPLLQDTLALTVLRSGEKVNVIPEAAELEVDCRLLPGQDTQVFLQEVRQVLNDPGLEIEVLLSETSVSSPVETLLFKAIAQTAGQFFPGITAVPELLTSSTDSHYFRELGITAYGFEPFCYSPEEACGPHGPDEKISTANITLGIQFLVEMVRAMDTIEHKAAKPGNN